MTDLMAGELIAIAMLGSAVVYLLGQRVRDTQPDVGVDIVDRLTEAEEKAMYDEYFPGVCGVCDGCVKCNCDGCDECGAPMVIDEDYELPSIEEDPVAIRLGLVPDPGDVKLTALGYVRYAGETIHRHCLDARRDGRVPCASCAPVMAGRVA